MAVHHESSVCLAVLNPNGRDRFVDYRNGPEAYRKGVHAPINYHAYAAATFGAFFDSVEDLLEQRDRFDAVLVLIRRRTWISLEAVAKLKREGLKVIVAWKECSPEQIAGQLKTRRAVDSYGQILEMADGILSATIAPPPRLGEIDPGVFLEKSRFLPTPYPLEYPDWDFSQPQQDRGGILIGTREFRTESRNHLQAITESALLAHQFALSQVTVINSEKKRGLAQLQSLSSLFPKGVFHIIERPLGYLDYMKLLSSHRLVYQRDRSIVPGQVAGDCLLARSLCAGGNSTIEQIAFSHFREGGEIQAGPMIDSVAAVLTEEETFQAAVRGSQEVAAARLSYAAVARELAGWDLLQ